MLEKRKELEHFFELVHENGLKLGGNRGGDPIEANYIESCS